MKYLFLLAFCCPSMSFCLCIYVFFTIFASIMRGRAPEGKICLIEWIGATKTRTRKRAIDIR